jgi:hypothetical protein
MIHSLLFEDCGCQDDPLAAFPYSGAQEQCAEVLLDRAGADFELDGDLLVTAPLDEEIEHLLIAAGDFDVIEVHGSLSRQFVESKLRILQPKHVFRQAFAFRNAGLRTKESALCKSNRPKVRAS